MSRYEEGEIENRLALFEDFELRGFVPLLPAQSILDFSRNHSLGNDGEKERKARVKRILAAGKALANVVRVDQKVICFDSKAKKFTIDVEPQTSDDFVLATSYSGILSTENFLQENLGDESMVEVVQSNQDRYIEEDEDEVIVFKPVVSEARADVVVSSWAPHEGLGPSLKAFEGDLNIHESSTSNPLNNINHQTLPVSVSGMMPQNLQPVQTSRWITEEISLGNNFEALRLFENGHVTKPGLQKAVDISNRVAFPIPVQQSVAADTNGVFQGLPKSSESYDPRISGLYLHIDTLNCGWAKVEEIRRQILNFRKSGKFVVAYVPSCREKEYYIACACEEIYAPPSAYFSLFGFTVQAGFVRGFFDNLGIEPQVERIGKYKSAGDQLTRKTMSEDNREMLTTLLDNIYSNWLDKVSSARGKKREDIENFINEGVYQVDKLKEEGFISSILYDDEVMTRLKERLRVKTDKNPPIVDFRKYSGVRKWTVGISGGKELIAVIRASGAIRRVESPLSAPSKGIIGEKFIEKIHRVRESKKFKAAIIRIDSPGGDALASDLMWREIRLLADSKPVITSMSDVAASGGYYMAMGAGTIVAESLTLTGSIGVVSGRFNLGKLYEKIGFNKEIISRGKYAELHAAEQRSLRPHEAELFAKSAQNIYKQFRDKAAFSRSMTVDKMEEVAQGRVWTGKDAASYGLVDAIGGLSRAIAIAKLKANIPQDRQVTVVELSRPSPSLPEILSGLGNSLVGADETLKELLHDLTVSDGVQVRMDGIMFQKLEGYPAPNPILALMKDYLGSM